MQLTPSHATQFILDWVHQDEHQKQTVQDYVKREPGYDLAFCRAWKLFDKYKDQPIKDSKSLLELLDRIHDIAISHLPEKKEVPGGKQIIHGKAAIPNHFNFLCFSKGVTSDQEGFKELIRKVCIEKDNAALRVHAHDYSYFWLLQRNSMKIRYQNGEEASVDLDFANLSEKDLEQIYETLVPLYEQGTCTQGRECVLLMRATSPKEREKDAIEILDLYFKQMNDKLSDNQKRITIVKTIKKINHLHIYYEGNGRSLYILNNILLYQNQLQLSYPINMCIFDGCSLQKVDEEIKEGQVRFSQMFGSHQQLTEGLNKYEATVEKLEKIIAKFAPQHKVLETSFIERNFNLLWRQSVNDKNLINLFKFLLEHKSELNIDIMSKGLKSGSALDIAKKIDHTEAIQLLNSKIAQMNL